MRRFYSGIKRNDLNAIETVLKYAKKKEGTKIFRMFKKAFMRNK